MNAIAVRGLRKSYGALEAVRGINFEVARGEVFGLLGPNGAGKTTTVEILEGYSKRDAGEVEVLGIDPATAGRRLARADRRRAPVLGDVRDAQRRGDAAACSPATTASRGRWTRWSSSSAWRRSATTRVRRLSGGQRRRLDLGLALVGDPELIFLDEPTTGFDPGARRRAWETIRGLRSLGKTILLTTHYLDEAEQLADRVAVLRARARSSPRARPPS